LGNCIQAAFSSGGGGGATVEGVSDRLTSNVTTTSTTLVTTDTNFTITVPTITDGVCILLANLNTQNSDSGSVTTASIYDVTNTSALCAGQTTTSGTFNNTLAITTATDGKEIQIYFSAPAGNTAYVVAQSGDATSIEKTANLSGIGIG